MISSSLRPMLAVDQPVGDNEQGFIHEIKWDGYRLLAHLHNADVRLDSRNGHNLNGRFPHLAAKLGQMGLYVVFDGEVVALNEQGAVDFSLLRSSRGADAQICYIVFDLLYLGNQILCSNPWFERRKRLESLVTSSDIVLLSPLLPGSVADCLAFAMQHGLEGIVSKRRDSPYLPGTRSLHWRKQRLKKRIDCLVIGLKMANRRVQSMAVALFAVDGSVVYLGNVGTGLSLKERDFLGRASEVLSTTLYCPCVNPPQDAVDWVWFQRFIVVEVEYFELTSSKRLRHPVFIRFRFDKDPKECVMEEGFYDK